MTSALKLMTVGMKLRSAPASHDGVVTSFAPPP